MAELITGVKRVWLNDHRIDSYTITQLHAETINTLGATILKTLEDAAKRQNHLGILIDISHEQVASLFLTVINYDIYNVGLTPPGYSQVEKFLKQHPFFRIGCAYVVSHAHSGKIVSSQRRTLTVNNISAKIFASRQWAESWLTGLESSS
jgi:hypothetical protein